MIKLLAAYRGRFKAARHDPAAFTAAAADFLNALAQNSQLLRLFRDDVSPEQLAQEQVDRSRAIKITSPTDQKSLALRDEIFNCFTTIQEYLSEDWSESTTPEKPLPGDELHSDQLTGAEDEQNESLLGKIKGFLRKSR